jgi:hypothetical protein
VALALLVVLYFALTRLIVTPLDQLALGGSRRSRSAAVDVPNSGVRELIELSASVRTMTESPAEEEAQRKKKRSNAR